MFTGIVEEIGKIKKASIVKGILKLDIEAKKICEAVNTGESISCDGVCLTLVGIKKNILNFDVMKSTYDNTTLGRSRKGDPVNLERSLRADSRLGGHFVTGHVDGRRKIIAFKKSGTTASLSIKLEVGDKDYVVENGSVCIEGISLTIAKISRTWLSVNLIPHTLKATTLRTKRAGDSLNVEFDILLKSAAKKYRPQSGALTKELLERTGFI